MDLETFHWLLTEGGQSLLAEAMAADLGDAARLATIGRLRRLANPARAAAAYEVAWVRRRAAAKFSRADLMYFTREALEQASGEHVAAHRAARYARLTGGRGVIADLCCGAGGDTLALAQVATVAAVDRDPLRLSMAAANARALGLADRVRPVALDLEQDPPPHADAIFFDPARRSGGRRVFALKAYAPPVALVHGWRERTPAIGVKVAPGVGDEELAELGVAEAEFISLDGELKEACLWFGELATGAARRATILSAAQPSTTLTDETPVPTPQLAEPLSFLYEPDPAVIRAQLVTTLAAQLGAAQLDRQIAYLTGDRVVATPFARCWRVIEWLPFGLKALRARLRAHDAGAVTVKKRGSPLDTDALARQLSGPGSRPLVVTLTQVGGRHSAIICEGPV